MRQIAIVTGLVVLLGCYSSDTFGAGVAGASFGQAPKVRDTEGVGHDFADFKDHVVLWFFWHPDRKESVEELKRMKDVYKKYHRSKLVVILFNMKNDNTAATRVLRGLGLDKRIKFPPKEINAKRIRSQMFNLSVSAGAGPVAQSLRVTEADTPFAQIMVKGVSFTWAGNSKQVDAKLEKELQSIDKAAGSKGSVIRNADVAVQYLDDAIAALKTEGEFSKAMEALSKIPDKSFKNPKLLPKATSVLLHIQMAMKDKPKQIERSMERYPKVRRKLQVLQRTAMTMLRTSLNPKQASKSGNKSSGGIDKEAIANRKLDAANKLRDAGDHFKAYDEYKKIAKIFSVTEAASTAADRILEYEKSAAFMKGYKLAAAESKAEAMLRSAESYRKANLTDLVKKTLKRIVDQYPDTEAATKAKEELAKLG